MMLPLLMLHCACRTRVASDELTDDDASDKEEAPIKAQPTVAAAGSAASSDIFDQSHGVNADVLRAWIGFMDKHPRVVPFLDKKSSVFSELEKVDCYATKQR